MRQHNSALWFLNLTFNDDTLETKYSMASSSRKRKATSLEKAATGKRKAFHICYINLSNFKRAPLAYTVSMGQLKHENNDSKYVCWANIVSIYIYV